MKIVKASCIVIFITGLLAGVFFSSSVSAQDISGTWHGKLSIPTGSLTIVFHISQTEQGAYVTTLDSPDQGANGIKTQTTSFNDSTLIIQIPVIHASYKGKLNKRIRRDRTTRQESFGFIFKVLILTIAPVILSSTVYNIQNVIDSAMFSSIMSAQGFSEKHCAALLGSLGQYYTLFNVPLFMANALGSSIVPPLVRAYEKQNKEQVHQKIEMAMRVTMLIAVPSAVAFFVIPKPMLDLIWGSIDNTVAANLFRIGSISIIFYAASTLTNAVLQGVNRMMAPVKNAATSLVIHIAALFVMLVFFHWSIYAVVASKVIFGLAMCILNSHNLREAVGYVQEKKRTFVYPAVAAVIMGIVVFVLQFVLALVISSAIATLSAIVVGICVYGISLLAIGGLTEAEILALPKGAKIARMLQKVHLLK